MAAYTPVQLATPAAITTVTVTKYTGANSLGVMRTYNFNTLTAHSVFLSIGTDAVGTRLLDSYLLTTSVPFTQNGWWVIPNAVILQTHADLVTTNAPVFGAWGYEYA